MFLFLKQFEAQIVLKLFLLFSNCGMILINNLKDKRSKISVTNKSNLSVRLIDLTHNNNTVTILFIYSSSLIKTRRIFL